MDVLTCHHAWNWGICARTVVVCTLNTGLTFTFLSAKVEGLLTRIYIHVRSFSYNISFWVLTVKTVVSFLTLTFLSDRVNQRFWLDCPFGWQQIRKEGRFNALPSNACEPSSYAIYDNRLHPNGWTILSRFIVIVSDVLNHFSILVCI